MTAVMEAPRHWGIRLPVEFIGLLVLYGGCGVVVGMAAEATPRLPPGSVLLAGAPLIAAMMIFAYRLLVRWLDRRPARELAAHGAVGGIAGGAVLGMALIAAVIAILFAMGNATIARGLVLFPATALGLSIMSGVGEEILFRGALFRIVEERFGTVVGLLISGSLFGALHIGNPGATVFSSAAIAIEAGLLLAAAYAATRSLWLPIGLHFGWNFAEGGIFGTAVSGGHVKGVLQTIVTGPDLVSGGGFGPEASIVAVLVCSAATAIFIAITLWRGEWKGFSLRNPR